MHEMSIAEGILDVALDTLRQHDASVIHSVQLDLGLMSPYNSCLRKKIFLYLIY